MNAIDLKAVKLTQELLLSTVIHGEVITRKRVQDALNTICILFQIAPSMEICTAELNRRNNIK